LAKIGASDGAEAGTDAGDVTDGALGAGLLGAGANDGLASAGDDALGRTDGAVDDAGLLPHATTTNTATAATAVRPLECFKSHVPFGRDSVAPRRAQDIAVDRGVGTETAASRSRRPHCTTAAGGTQQIHVSKPLGPATNTIDATLTVEIAD